MNNREFLMLAKTFDPKKHRVGGWFVSEKLDGQRAFWDGGISRGVPKKDVPWANTAKDYRYVEAPVATGLWSRYGNVIHAPDWWLDKLPPVMLDGELWNVRGQGARQDLMSTIKKLKPGMGWEDVIFYVFGMPCPEVIFRDGRINNPNFRKIFKDVADWQPQINLAWEPHSLYAFERVIAKLHEHVQHCNTLKVLAQERLPYQTAKAMVRIDEMLTSITDCGGEGLILRKPESFWTPKRIDGLLKVKKLNDSEGTVTGYITGRETDRGSKLLGLMGALILNFQGKRLELSGFTDDERVLGYTPEFNIDHNPEGPRRWAMKNPGEEVPEWIQASHFPRGSVVTFRYRGLTRDGIPQEARYWRQR